MLKSIFLSNPIQKTSGIYDGYHTNLRNKFTFNPHNVDYKYIDVFKNMVVNDLENVKVKKVRDPMFIRKGESKKRCCNYTRR